MRGGKKRASVLAFPLALTADDILGVDDSPKTDYDKGWEAGFRAGAKSFQEMQAFRAYLKQQLSAAVLFFQEKAKHHRDLQRGRRMTAAREKNRGGDWRAKARELDQRLLETRSSLSRKSRAEIIGKRLGRHWQTVRRALPSSTRRPR